MSVIPFSKENIASITMNQSKSHFYPLLEPSIKLSDSTSIHQACPKCLCTGKTYAAADYLEIKFTRAEIETAENLNLTNPEDTQILFYLVKPSEPRKKKLLVWLVLPFFPGINLLMIIAMWFAPMHRVSKIILAGIFLILIATMTISPYKESGDFAYVGCFLILFYYMAILLDIWRQKKVYLKDKIPNYERAMLRWPHLRYCQNCEICWMEDNPSKFVTFYDVEKLLNNSNV